MPKTDVYSWRLSSARKAALEDAARSERTSLSKLLDRATDEWMRNRRARTGRDDEEQRRLRAAATRFVGTLRGGDPSRSRQARMRLKSKLAQRHGG